MKLKSLIVGAVAGLLLTACGSPEDVTKSFVEALAAGDCGKAKGMAVESALEEVEASEKAGCKEYTSEIVSVECDEATEDAVSCSCKEQRDMEEMDYITMLSSDSGEVKYSYDLKKVEGEWKVSAFYKEMNSDQDPR